MPLVGPTMTGMVPKFTVRHKNMSPIPGQRLAREDLKHKASFGPWIARIVNVRTAETKPWPFVN